MAFVWFAHSDELDPVMIPQRKRITEEHNSRQQHIEE